MSQYNSAALSVYRQRNAYAHAFNNKLHQTKVETQNLASHEHEVEECTCNDLAKKEWNAEQETQDLASLLEDG